MPRLFKTDDPNSIGRKLSTIEKMMERKIAWKRVELLLVITAILIALFI